MDGLTPMGPTPMGPTPTPGGPDLMKEAGDILKTTNQNLTIRSKN